MSIIEILKKQTKSLEEVHFLYEEIRKFSFFKEFQERSLKAWELEDVLSLCKSFGYEECQNEQFLFKVGDVSSDKVYVVLSGQLEITNFIKPPPPLNNSSFRKGQRRGVKNHRNQSLEISDFHLPPNHVVPTPKRASMELRDNSPLKDLKTETTIQACTSQILPNASNMHRSSLFMLESVYISEITSLQINDESHLKSKEEIVVFKQEENFESYKRVLQLVKEEEILAETCLNEEPSSLRLSSAVCKTDCKFLVMNKEFFDLMTEKKKEDKEEFLKHIFPSFKNIISYADLRYLLKSFTTEVFNKGSLVTSEKTEVQPEEAKLYLIFKGECRIEKNLELEKNIPFDKSRPVVGNQQPIHISFLGKGMIIGEEILTNDKNEYSYNVKVSSDVLFVYSITKREFKSSFFEKICQQVLNTFEKKKTQRETIFESVKKDYEAKMLSLLPETMNYAKNVPISHLITRSASMSLNRYVSREQKINEQKEGKITQTPVMSPKSPIFQPQVGKQNSPRRSPLDFSEALQDDVIVPVVKVEEKRMIKLIETDNPKRMKLETKMQFVSKIPFDKKDVEVPNPRNLENFKLFPETDPQKLKYLRVLKVKSSGSFKVRPKAATPTATNSPQHRFGSILKEQLKDTSNYHELSQNLVDVIRPQTQNGTARERPTSAFSYSMPSSPKSPARHFAIERLLSTPQHKNRELRPNRNVSTAASNNASPTHQNNFGEFARKVISANQSLENTDGIRTPDMKNSNNWLESRIQESPSRWRQLQLRPSSQGLKSPGRSSFLNLEDIDSNGSATRNPIKPVQPSLHLMNLQLIKPRTAHNKRLADAKARQQRVFQKTATARPQSASKGTPEMLGLTGIKR